MRIARGTRHCVLPGLRYQRCLWFITLLVQPSCRMPCRVYLDARATCALAHAGRAFAGIAFIGHILRSVAWTVLAWLRSCALLCHHNLAPFAILSVFVRGLPVQNSCLVRMLTAHLPLALDAAARYAAEPQVNARFIVARRALVDTLRAVANALCAPRRAGSSAFTPYVDSALQFGLLLNMPRGNNVLHGYRGYVLHAFARRGACRTLIVALRLRTLFAAR